MKKQNGMSYIMLILWIIVIIAVGVIGVRLLSNESKKRKIENIATDMLLVQGKIKVISQENEMNEEESPLIGKKLSENLEDTKVKNLIDKKIITEEGEALEKYYIIDSEAIITLNLEDNLNGEYYIVNYETYEIIYSKGIEFENEMHYTLTELLEHRDKEEAISDENIENVNEEVTEQVNEEAE